MTSTQMGRQWRVQEILFRGSSPESWWARYSSSL